MNENSLEDALIKLPDILYYSDIYTATLYFKDKVWHLDYLNSNRDSFVEFMGESPWEVIRAAYNYCKKEEFINE